MSTMEGDIAQYREAGTVETVGVLNPYPGEAPFRLLFPLRIPLFERAN